MVDHSQPKPQPSPAEALSELEQQLQFNIARIAMIFNDDPEASPVEVLPNTKEVDRRSDVSDKAVAALTSEDEGTIRAAMAEFGVGREANRGPEAVGLRDGYTLVLSGGQVHKMQSEANVALNSDVQPGSVIICADAEQTIIKTPEEQALAAQILGIEQGEVEVGETEYRAAERVLRANPNFVAEDEVILPYGYTIDGQLANESTGQFRQIGTINGAPAIVMRVDREWYDDPATGKRRFKRPKDQQRMQAVAQLPGVEQIGYATSHLYQQFAEISAILAMRELTNESIDVSIKVPTYGTAELARVKGESATTPPSLTAVASEAQKLAQAYQRLIKAE